MVNNYVKWTGKFWKTQLEEFSAGANRHIAKCHLGGVHGLTLHVNTLILEHLAWPVVLSLKGVRVMAPVGIFTKSQVQG